MSDYHVLSADEEGNAHSVAMHIPVPDQNNNVSYSYRTALVESLGGAANIESAVPFISGAELTQLQAGELYEEVVEFPSNPGQDLASKRDALDAMFSSQVTETQAMLQNKLGFWGYSRDVP